MNGASVSADGEYLAVSSAIGVYLYRAGTLEDVWFSLTETAAHSVTFSEDSTLVAGGTETGLISVWDVETGRLLLTLQQGDSAILSLAFSPDGARLAASAGFLGDIVYGI
jgi:WD40 repeat protein